MPKPKPTLEEINASLIYDPHTGYFYRRKTLDRVVTAISLDDGYYRISVKGRQYLAHVLAMTISNGHWPEFQVDHANGDRGDNRLANLRLCTISENRWNSRIRKRNTSGRKGVTWDKSRGLWMAQIMAHRKKENLGRFKTVDEAHAAYCEAAKRLHGEFARFE